jgi:ATP-binding cassette subfamily B protein
MSNQGTKYPKVTISSVLREYFRVARPFWLTFIIVAISANIPVIAGGIIVPIYYKNFFDILTVKADISILASELIHTIFLILIMNFFGWAGYRFFSFAMVHLQTGIMNRLRQDSYEYLIGHSYSFFTNSFSGSLVQKINRFMRSFERMMDRFFGEIMPIIVKIIGVCIVLWYIQPVFVLLILGWVTFYFILSLTFSRWKIPYDIKTAEIESKATAALADSLSNHVTIQMFNRHNHESSLFGDANTAHTNALKSKWNVSNYIEAIQAFMNIVIEFIIFFVAIKYWSIGMVSIGTFVMIQIYILSLMDSFWGGSRILRDLYEAFGDAKEMVEILQMEHGIKDVHGAKPLVVNSGHIVLDNISFGFNSEKSVLDNILLDIKAGERIALIGPSGAGKSTLTKLILRLYDIQSGKIEIDSQDISQVTQGSLREAISFVPQDPILFHRSLLDNIRYGQTGATEEQVIEAAKLAHCHEFISALPGGYRTFVGERGIKLSGGERQRVAIARAILKNAPILILDEATSSLDSASEVLIQDALDVLMKGKTVIVIAHRLSTIRKMDRIIVIDGGKILEQGTHDELISRDGGMYSKLWSLQSDGFIASSKDRFSKEKIEDDSDSTF